MNLFWLIGAAVIGFVLGGLYFGGLWWTVRSMTSVRHPALLFLASFLLRVGTLLGGFVLFAGKQWELFAACVLGFIVARTVVVRCLRDTEDRPSAPEAMA